MKKSVSDITDFGKEPLVINIENATAKNNNFRTALWTGEHMQVTLMSIPVGGEIGVEMHSGVDQLLRIEQGCATVMIGKSKNSLHQRNKVNKNYAIIIPSGTWHNVVNTGNVPLKIYSIYAPPQHPFGTVHKTKKDSDRAENH